MNTEYIDGTASLTEREQLILRSVVESFVHSGEPVGSRALARRAGIQLSPATIRNTMSDLEELGYLGHPYTSAGRVPTQRGYRVYVDALMGEPTLPAGMQAMLYAELYRVAREFNEVWRQSSQLLGRLSNLLGVVLTPRMSTGVFHKLDVVPLSTSRALFIISVRSGLVRTIVLEVDFEFKPERLSEVVSVLNERLSGLTLEQIRNTFADRVRDLVPDPTGLIGLVTNHVSVLFDESEDTRRVSLAGRRNIVALPEFQDQDSLSQVMDLLDDDNIIVQLFEKTTNEAEEGAVDVRIGDEVSGTRDDRYSIVATRYHFGDTDGAIGVMGPTRMDYGRVIALVEQMASLLSREPGEWEEGDEPGID